jgi:hypothetical protein
MADPAGQQGAFTVHVNPDGANTTINVDSVALDVDAKAIVLTLASVAGVGDTITLDYTPGTIAATDGNELDSFSGQRVINNVPVPVTSDTVTVDPYNPILAITAATPSGTNITIPAGVENAGLYISDLLNTPADSVITSDPLPGLNITSTLDLNGNGSPVNVQITIPDGTTVSVPDSAGWDGTISMPTIQPASSVTVIPSSGKTAVVNSVIEIGFGDTPLTFNHAVRILIPGQAGKKVGYSRNGVFTPITTV